MISQWVPTQTQIHKKVKKKRQSKIYLLFGREEKKLHKLPSHDTKQNSHFHADIRDLYSDIELVLISLSSCACIWKEQGLVELRGGVLACWTERGNCKP